MLACCNIVHSEILLRSTQSDSAEVNETKRQARLHVNFTISLANHIEACYMCLFIPHWFVTAGLRFELGENSGGI